MKNEKEGNKDYYCQNTLSCCELALEKAAGAARWAPVETKVLREVDCKTNFLAELEKFLVANIFALRGGLRLLRILDGLLPENDLPVQVH